MAPVAGSNTFSDLAFIEHIVRAVATRMVAGASNMTPRSGGEVTIVQWVKGMREMGCMTYHGEEDAEVAGHWLRKVERVINQMQMQALSFRDNGNNLSRIVFSVHVLSIKVLHTSSKSLMCIYGFSESIP